MLEDESTLGPIERAVATRVDALIDDLESASHRIASTLPALRATRTSVPVTTASRTRPETEPSVQPESVRIEIDEASLETLLDFQEQLSLVPGIADVAVAPAAQGGISLHVRLEGANRTADVAAAPPETVPAIVCVMCGELISEGRQPASHGLCPDCTVAFLKGEAPR